MSRYYKFAELTPEDNDDVAFSEEGENSLEESNSKESESEKKAEAEKKAKGILSKFMSLADTVQKKLRSMLSHVPFSAEVISLYFYVLDTNSSIFFRAIVATVLLVITGIITSEVGGDLVSAILSSIPGGVVAALPLQAIMKALEATTLIAAIPAMLVIYYTLVKEDHLQQAKDFLKAAGLKIYQTSLTKYAMNLALAGQLEESQRLVKVACQKIDRFHRINKIAAHLPNG
ncbi:MAG: hypothetical protein EB127_21880 [Alphaproteobacteria bacterium]|nr:hypothetical protein [Alphaproteobacteria bacterium]